MKCDKTIYRLTIGDIQNVALELLGRKLIKEEVDVVKKKLDNLIPWFDAIENAISLSHIK